MSVKIIDGTDAMFGFSFNSKVTSSELEILHNKKIKKIKNLTNENKEKSVIQKTFYTDLMQINSENVQKPVWFKKEELPDDIQKLIKEINIDEEEKECLICGGVGLDCGCCDEQVVDKSVSTPSTPEPYQPPMVGDREIDLE